MLEYEETTKHRRYYAPLGNLNILAEPSRAAGAVLVNLGSLEHRRTDDRLQTDHYRRRRFQI